MHMKTFTALLAILALGFGGLVMAGSASVSAQQVAQQQQKQQQQRRAPNPTNVAPRRTGPAVTPQINRQVTPRITQPTTRVAPRIGPTVTPQTSPRFTQPQQRRVAPLVPRTVTPNVGTAPVSRLRGLPARGAGNASIRGRNFSVWRGAGYRVRRGDRWRTFVAIGLLSPILFGASYYYPYAYIAAPQDYCDGFTEDGCQLRWQGVETLEGDFEFQCVAYCPWQ